MTWHLWPLALLAACSPRLAGTADGPVPERARAVVLWQGWEVLGAEGGSGRVQDGAFALSVHPAREAAALGASELPDALVGLVVVVDAPMDEAALRDPASITRVLGADPQRVVRADDSGESCLDCASGSCVATACDGFALTLTDRVLDLPFAAPWGGEPGLVYDETGSAAAFARRDLDEIAADASSVYTTELGEPRVRVATLDGVVSAEPRSFHAGEGLLVVDTTAATGERAARVLGADGAERWRVAHGTEAIVDGPYLSGDGRLLAWATPTRVAIADAHTGTEVASQRISEDHGLRVRWSTTHRGVFVFPAVERPFTVGVTAKDWPWCDGSPSLAANRCAPSGEHWGLGLLGQVTRAPDQVCDQVPFGSIPRASSPPTELLDCEP